MVEFMMNILFVFQRFITELLEKAHTLWGRRERDICRETDGEVDSTINLYTDDLVNSLS